MPAIKKVFVFQFPRLKWNVSSTTGDTPIMYPCAELAKNVTGQIMNILTELGDNVRVVVEKDETTEEGQASSYRYKATIYLSDEVLYEIAGVSGTSGSGVFSVDGQRIAQGDTVGYDKAYSSVMIVKNDDAILLVVRDASGGGAFGGSFGYVIKAKAKKMSNNEQVTISQYGICDINDTQFNLPVDRFTVTGSSSYISLYFLGLTETGNMNPIFDVYDRECNYKVYGLKEGLNRKLGFAIDTKGKKYFCMGTILMPY